MKKLALGLALSGAVLAIAAPANAAVTLTAAVAPANYSTSGTFTYNFDTRPANLTDGTIVNPGVTVSGQHAVPYGSDGGYLSVGPTDGSPATLTLSGPITSISFLWGSVDTYNTLTLLGTSNPANSGNPYAFTGIDALNPANGYQGNGGSVVVTLTLTGADVNSITGLEFASSQNAFEVDSLNVSGVPEPATWAMMIGGFGLVGMAMRRRSRARVSVAFA